MREQKFRACINKNTVIYFTFEDLVNPRPLFSIRELLIPWLRKGNKPDDYIGLTDKNGKEIYEGDIVKFPIANGDLIAQEVKFDRGVFTTKSGRMWGFDKDTNFLGFYEVIGNIYENPELLG